MIVGYRLFTILILVILFSSCKEDDPAKPDYSGVYTASVIVKSRPIMYEPEYATSNCVFLYDQYMDTSKYVCCKDQFKSEAASCPSQYEINHFEIFKHNNNYYLRNTINYNFDSVRITYDIPLEEKGGRLVFENTKESKNKVVRPGLPNYDDTYPAFFNILYLSIDVSTGTPTFGNWIIHDGSNNSFSYNCINSDDGKTYRYGMGEFADIRLTKK